MPNVYLFVPPDRQVEIVAEFRRHEQYNERFRAFIDHCWQMYAARGFYQAMKPVHDVSRLIDSSQPEELRIGAAERLLQRMGPFMASWRWSIVEPRVHAQAVMHKRLLDEEMWLLSLKALFVLLHEESSLLLSPAGDFYSALRDGVARNVTTDVLGAGWTRSLKRRCEVIMDPIAIQEMKADIPVEDLPALDELFSTLPDRKRELMTLHYVHDLPVKQIAERCQITVNAVTSHLTQARQILRRRFS